MLGVMLLSNFLRDYHEFHSNKFEALSFEALNNLTCKAALNTIRLNQDECAFQQNSPVYASAQYSGQG
jgi:hypothetical protein